MKTNMLLRVSELFGKSGVQASLVKLCHGKQDAALQKAALPGADRDTGTHLSYLRSLSYLLFSLALMSFTPLAAQANTNFVWHYTNNVLNYQYVLSDSSLITINTNNVAGKSTVELILQAESKYRTSYAEYTTNLASLVNGRFGPNVSVRLAGPSGTYPVSGQYTSRIIDGGSGVIWDMLQFRASDYNYVPDTSLRSLYRMDNDNWREYVSRSYATASNSPTFSSDAQIGPYSGSFGGELSRDHIVHNGESLSGYRALTMACWVKLRSLSDFGGYMMVRENNSYAVGLSQWAWRPGLYLKGLGFGPFEGNGGTYATANNVIESNVWHFAVGTWDADGDGKARLYVDGSCVSTASVAKTSALALSDRLKIGWDDWQSQRFTDGVIDEAAIWNRALSASEVSQLYKSYAFTFPLRFHVRSGTSTADVATKAFVGPDGTGDTYYTDEKSKIISSADFDLNGQYAQFKAFLFSSTNNTKTPYVESAGFLDNGGLPRYDLTMPDVKAGSFATTTNEPGTWDTPYLGISKQLNGGYYASAAYTSGVFDAGVPANWNTLDWDSPQQLSSSIYGLVDLWWMNGDWASAMGGPGGSGVNDDFTSFAKLGTASALFNGVNAHTVFNINTNVQTIEFWLSDELPVDGLLTVTYNTTNSFSLSIDDHAVRLTGLKASVYSIYVNGLDAPNLLVGWNHICVSLANPLFVNSIDLGVVGADYMAGQVDDMAIYKRAVGRGEAYAHYQNAAGPIGGQVKAQVRFGNTLPLTNAFAGFGGNTNLFYGDADPLGPVAGRQYFQYKLYLTGDGNITPAIKSIALNSSVGTFVDDTRDEINRGGPVSGTTMWYGDAIKLEQKARFGPVSVVPDGFTEGVWHMDEASWGGGPTVIDSWRNRHGTPGGNANSGAGGIVGNRCGVFDGSNSVVSIPSQASSFAGDFSVHLWFNSDDTNRSAIISCDDASGYYTVELNGDGASTVPGALAFVINDTGATRTLVSRRRGLNNGAWHHLAAIRSGDQMHIYLDGARDNSMAIAPFGNTGTGTSLFVGKRGNRPTPAYYKGLVDELALFSRALSGAEVGNFYAGGYRTDVTAVFESDPIDNGQPAIWQTLFWSTDGTYGNRLYVNGDAQLTALWSFEGGSTTNSRGINNLTVNPTVSSSSAGRIGDCVQLTGGSEYLQVANHADLEPVVLTVEAWVYMNAADSRAIIDKHATGNGYRLGTTGAGLPYFMLGGKTVTGYLPIRIQKWTHVLGSYDGTQLRLYVDGDLASIDANAVGENAQSGGSLRIGELLATGQSFDGRIDEIAIHSRALNAGEILDHYKAGAVTLRFQCRTDNTSPIPGGIFYRGPGGSSNTYFTIGVGDDMVGDLPLAQHLQFKAYLATEDYRYTPSLNGVKAFVSSYSDKAPYVYTTVTNGYWFLGDLISFAEDRTSFAGTAVGYQISGDVGNPPSRWYYWDNTKWSQATLLSHTNSAATVSSNIGSFYDELYPKTGGVFRVRQFLKSLGDQQISVDSMTLQASEGRIVVTSPNGTENGDDAWTAGVDYDITWDWAGNVGANLVVEFSRTGPTGAWETVTNSVPRGAPGSGSLTWRMPEAPLLTNCFIRVRDPGDTTLDDQSDGAFTIIQSFKVTAPNGGEKWYMGTTTNITWESPYEAGVVVQIDFAGDGTNYNVAQRLELITPNNNNSKTNAYAWTIPWDTNYLSAGARIRVETTSSGNYTDESDLPFQLAGIVLQEPSAGRKVKRLDTFNILWQSQGAGTNVEIHLSDDGGLTFTNLVTASTVNQNGTNSYVWNVTQLGTDIAMLRVRSVSDGNVLGYSQIFTLADIDVTAPDGAEVWLMETTNQIQWTSGGAGPTVGLYYSTNSGLTYTQIGAGPVTNSGSYDWIMPRNVSQRARVKVVSEGSGAQSDTNLFSISAANFNIAGIRIRYPDLASDIINMGQPMVVLHDGAPTAWPSVSLEVTYNEANSWSSLGAGASNWNLGAAFQFTPNYPTTKAKIRGTINSSPPYTNVYDLSDQYFTIAGVLINSPTNGSVYNIGGAYQVKWVSAGAANTAYIDYSNQGTNNFINLTTLGVGNIETYPGQNTYNWNVAANLLPSTNARVRVRAGAYKDISAAFVLRGIRITTPTTGTVWNVGTTGLGITWISAGVNPAAAADLWLSTDGGATFPYELTNSWLTSIGGFSWNYHPDYDPTTNAVIRMRINSSPTLNDTNVVAYSDPFVLKGIKVRQPVAGTSWELGTTQTVNFISAAAGAQATISYSANGGASYEALPITNSMAIVDGFNTFQWAISKTRQPSTNVVLRVAGTAYTGYSQPFTVGGVKVNRPFQFDIWAVGESNLIDWVSIGTDGTNTIELIYPTGDTNYVITNAFAGGSSLTWLVDAGVIPGTNDSMTGVVLRVTDTGGYAGLSEPFKLVSSPRIEIGSPLAGEFWKVGETNQIQWLKGGQMNAGQFKVFYSRDDFTSIPGEVLTPVTFNASNNLFSVDWVVPDELGPTKILVTNTANALVYDYSGEFDICGNFRVIFPNGDPAEPELYALNQGNVSWGTRGSVNNVDLYYRYGATGTWARINGTPLINNPAPPPGEIISGASWNPLPYTESSSVKFRVQDSKYTNIFDGVTPGPYDDSNNYFPLKWYTVYWDVFYLNDLGFTQRMDKLSVSDSSGWSASDQSTVSAPLARRYPYGVYDTAWYREFFHDQVDFHWVCNSNFVTRGVEMRKSEVEPDYHVLSDFAYQISNRIFKVHSWLERGGAILTDPANCKLSIYDNTGAEIASTVSVTPDPNGVFWQNWDVKITDPSGAFKSDDLFFAKVEIEYSGVKYSAGMTFALRLAAGEETVQAMEAIVSAATSNILVSVSGVSSNVSLVSSNLTAFRASTGGSLSNIQADVSGIALAVAGMSGLSNAIATITNSILPRLDFLTNSIGIIEPAITNLSSQMTNVVEDSVSDLSRILTRPTSVAFGSTNSILYKSRKNWAGAVTIAASNATQGTVYSGNMAEIIPGIYSADLTCGWGTNTYIITCRDPYPASDSMVLNVVGADPDVVPNMVLSISNQLVSLETQITNLESTVSGLAGADMSGVMASLDSISNSLTQVKAAVGTPDAGVDLSSVISAIQGINIPEGEALDLSALSRIEQQLGSLANSDSGATLLGSIESLAGDVASASQKAQGAKSEAANAASGVDEIKDKIGATDLDKAINKIAELKAAVDAQQANFVEMEKLKKLGLLYDSIYKMASTIEDLAQREGFKNFLIPEVPKVGTGEGLSTDDQIANLMMSVKDMQGSMVFMTKLMDDIKNEPVVTVDLIGE